MILVKLINDDNSSMFIRVSFVISAIIFKSFSSMSTNLLNKEETNILYKITRLAFGQRRKMLRNSLASIKINNSILDLSQRPEMLSISEFKRLARWVASRKIS